MRAQSFSIMGGYAWLLLLLASGVTFAKVHNPVGVPYSQEMFILLLFAFAFLYLSGCLIQNITIPSAGVVVLLLVLFYLTMSPLLAKYMLHQPYIYGVIEERRVAMLLVFFPVYYLMRGRGVSADRLTQIIVAIAVAASAVMVVSSMTASGGDAAAAGDDLREGRMGAGVAFVALSALILLAALLTGNTQRLFPRSRRPLVISVVLLGVFVGEILFIVQSRQTFLGIGIAAVAVAAVQRGRGMLVLGLGVIAAAVAFIQSDRLVDLFGQLVSDQYLEQSARSRAIDIIFSALRDSSYVGMGALYQGYRGGFEELYGPNFYLSDVGIFGTFYRFGFLAVIPVFLWLTVYLRVMRSVNDMFVRVFARLYLVYFVALWPVGGVVEYRGAVAGVVLAIAAAAGWSTSRGRDRMRDKPAGVASLGISGYGGRGQP